MIETGLVSKLPVDILIDILSRLPVSNLSECRWVSKSWYNLIRHPSFVKAQHNRAIIQQQHNPPNCIIFESISNKAEASYCFTNTKNFNPLNAVIPVSSVFKILPEHDYSLLADYSILASVNGLLCLTPDPCWGCSSQSQPYYICNPVTGKGIRLPNHNLTNGVVSGFAFDSVTNTYKIVRIAVKDNVEEENFEGEIFTLGSKDCSWRSINSVPDFVVTPEKYNVFVAGALHWFGFMPTLGIISFQVGSEEFGEIQFPSKIQEEPQLLEDSYTDDVLGFECYGNRCYYLTVIGECLSLCVFGNYDSVFWVMEEYGVQGSWTKKYVLDQYVIHNEDYGQALHMYEIIKVMSNGEVLLISDRKFFGYYHIETGRFKPVSVEGFKENYPQRRIFHFPHVESLISPRNITNYPVQS